MTPHARGAGRLKATTQRGRHRAPRRHKAVLVRTIGVGGVACFVGLLAELNAPDADALSILLPAGNGNATQINVLEGNIFDPQFGLGGDGANASDNSTLGGLMFGLGNGQTEGTSGGLFGTIALGGATGNGNVTQINILSYNIFNPQWSISGGNTSNNETISNVAMGNGHDSVTTADSAGSSLFGGAVGNGNTTQLSLFSGNIFNPQFSLFGDNTSNNVAISNVSATNGYNSTTSLTSGGFLGAALFGMAGNGNSTQLAAFTTNILNPQISLLGNNASHNTSNTNQATANGNGGGNELPSTGILGGVTSLGTTGNGNAIQNAFGTGMILNDQLRIGLGGLVPSPSGSQETLTNEQVTSGDAAPTLSDDELLELQNRQPGTTSGTGIVLSPRPLTTIASRLKDAVDRTLGRITNASTDSGGTESQTSRPDSATP